jgi:3-hydroxy-9,10-secoandrosta-1,3,5(10)-triene-9,17-dione monooxygenase
MSATLGATSSVTLPGHDELVARAAALIPLLERNAAQTEQDRRVAEENITALREAGLFKVTVPARFGGYEAGIPTKVAVSRELGKGDGSTAWAVTLLNVCAWFTGLFGEQAQQDVWGADPDARIAGVFTPSGTTTKVDGGYRVTGSWGFASGSWHAQWATVGVPLTDESGQVIDQALALIPMADLSIKETWFVAGMSGTGSNTIVAEDVFVPGHRFISIIGASQGKYQTPYTDEVLYRAAFLPVGCLVLLGPVLGMANAALQYVLEKAKTRGIAYTTYELQSDAPTAQIGVARAAAMIRAAEAVGDTVGREIMEYAARGDQMPTAKRTALRLEVAWAAKTAREAVNSLVTTHGASSFALKNPLQRIFRDIETATRHAFLSYDIAEEVHGRQLMGNQYVVSPLS